MTRRLRHILAALVVACVSSACAPDESRVRQQASAPTFVSLNPCLDAILIELAPREKILALSHYSHQPGGSRMDRDLALSFPATGGTAEEIIALEPDIVLASVFLSPATRRALETAGLRVETFDSPRTLAASAEQVDQMSKLVNTPDASSAAAALKSEVLSLRTTRNVPSGANPNRNPSVLLWQAGQIVAGQETLIAALLKEAGFTSHSEALGLGQADYVTLEQVLSDPPDLLLVAGSSAGQQHPALAKLANTRVHYFDPNLFYCGGPSVADARAELRALRRRFEGGAL